MLPWIASNFAKNINKLKGIILMQLLFFLDYREYLKNSISIKGRNDIEYICTHIRLCVHSIEKGLSLKRIKPGFGMSMAKDLLQLLLDYERLGDTSYDPEAYTIGIDALHTYINFSKSNNTDVSQIEQEMGERMLCGYGQTGVLCLTQTHLSNKSRCNFEEFAKSRHTIRNFGDENIDKGSILESISLAQTSPSACNRQPTKVYVATNQELCEEVAEIQGGCSGIENIRAFLVITSNIHCYRGAGERNTAYVDGGIFAMNLVYALHSQNIATCLLIWGGFPKKERWAKRKLDICSSEKIVCLIAVGSYPKEVFHVATSKRRELNTIVKFVNEKTQNNHFIPTSI